MAPGDIIRFHDGSAVVLLEMADGHAWRVLYVRGIPEWPQGLVTWISREALSSGEIVDWNEVDEAMDHLHEMYHAAARLEEDIMARVDGR